ncbi:ImmA/IrrE family metallo-endopeptidase [Microbacterium sp. SSM24]|uniref:ImmA/IrrE family metallo-endopeptidase n=1 Tax=Microbacterium sp. SSM24 TaxID=2991714 RepID=UPI00222728F2|nr:ImmA/IrrE family metallo-endopeptidase [Microbacterium sp. SSM24]MCW3492028.1 ImmA/IrrE family metallo-endopeptidase [Microbacterium sp. SSM24]
MTALQLLSSERDVRRYARGALRAASAGEELPVPLADIAAAAELHKEALFDLGGHIDLPAGIRAIIHKLRGTVLGLLDVQERRYYVDASLTLDRRRFTEAHEIGHHTLPWHRLAYFADDYHTLATDTRDLLELEANLFSAEILFAGDRFNREADDWAPSLDVPLALNGRYQVSAAAAIRRYISDSSRPVAVVGTGMFSSASGALPIFEGITSQSVSFAKKYGPVRQMLPKALTPAIYPGISAIRPDKRGKIDACEMVLQTNRGAVRFAAEGFVNGRNGFIVLARRSRAAGQRLTLI